MNKILRYIFAISILFGCATTRVMAQSKTYYVKAQHEVEGDGSSWDKACSLFEALAKAEAGDKIFVKGYTEDLIGQGAMYYTDDASGYKLKSGVSLYGGFKGDETDYSQVEHNGTRYRHKYQSVIIADQNDNDEIDKDYLIYPENKTRSDNHKHSIVLDLGSTEIHKNDNNIRTIISGFNIVAGNACGNSEEQDGHGGGIIVINSNENDGNAANRSFEISNCFLSNNYGRKGGAIYVDKRVTSSNSVIKYCGLYNNAAGNRSGSENQGGGIWLEGNATVHNCVILNNANGGVRLSGGSKMVNCSVVHNSVSAIDLTSEKSASSAENGTVYNTVIWGNTALSKTEPQPTYRYCAYPEVVVTDKAKGTDANGNKQISFQNHSTEPAAWFVTPASTVGYDRSFSIRQSMLPNFSMQVEESSALIDAGNPEYFTNLVSGESTDLAGNNRIDNVNKTIDIGAYQREKITNRLYVTQNGAGNKDGSSWNNAMSDLQAAINKIATIGRKGEVWVAEGTYQPTSHMDANNANSPFSFQMKDGVSVVGGFVGGETARSQREFGENSWEAKHPTILQGYEFSSNPSYSSTAGWQANSKSYHVVWFAPAPGGAAFQNTTYLDGVTIEGGSITRSTESTIDKNYAPYLGAGVYLNDAKAYLRNSIVRYNNASMTSATSADAITPQGGGVYCKGGQVRYCLVYNNSAQQGGGVFVDEQGFVGNCMVTNNSGQKGGGVYLRKGENGNSLYQILGTSIISNNTSMKNGAVYVEGSGLVVQNTIVNNNTPSSTDAGDTETTYTGGLYITKECTAINNILWNNTLLQSSSSTSSNAQVHAGKDATRDIVKLYNNAISDVNASVWNNIYQSGTYEMATTYQDRAFELKTGTEYSKTDDINNKVGVQSGWTGIDYFWTLRQGSQLRRHGLLYAELPYSIIFKPSTDFLQRNFETNPPIGAYMAEAYPLVFEYTAAKNRLRLYYDRSNETPDGNGSSWANSGSSINNMLSYLGSLKKGDTVKYLSASGTNPNGTKDYILKDGDRFEICAREGTYTPVTPYTFMENDAKAKTVMVPATDLPVYILGGYPSISSMADAEDGDRDPKSHRTEFNGNVNGSDLSEGLYHVVRIESGANVTFDGIAITHGYAAGTADTPYGGGILIGSSVASNKNTYVTLRNCIIEDNTALHGAAIGVTQDTKNIHLTLENTVLNNNSCETDKTIESHKDAADINGYILEAPSLEGNKLEMRHVTIVNNIGQIPSTAVMGTSSFAAGNYIYDKDYKLILPETNNTVKLAAAGKEGAVNFSNPTREPGAHMSANVYLGGNAEFRPLTSSEATAVLINQAKEDGTSTLTTDINGEERDLGGAPDLGAYEAILPKAGKVIYVRSYNTVTPDNTTDNAANDQNIDCIDGTPNFNLLGNGTSYDGSTWSRAINGNAVCDTHKERTGNDFYVNENGKMIAATLDNTEYGADTYNATSAPYAQTSNAYSSFFPGGTTGSNNGNKSYVNVNGRTINQITNNRDEQYVSGLQYAVEKAAAYNAAHKNDANFEPMEVWVAGGVYTDSKGFVIRDGVKVYGGFRNQGNPGKEDRHPLLSQYVPARKGYEGLKKSEYETILQIRKESPVYMTKSTREMWWSEGKSSDGSYYDYIQQLVNSGKTQRHTVLYQPDVCLPTWGVSGDGKGSYTGANQYRYPGFGSFEDNQYYKEYKDVVWDGFSIRHGYITNYEVNRDGGGGVRAFRGIKLENLIIVNNLSHGKRSRGGGLYMDGDNSQISNSYLLQNLVWGSGDCYGGGAYMIQGTGFNMVVASNRSLSQGGGIFIESAKFFNNTVAYNMANNVAGTGIMHWQDNTTGIESQLSLYNCLLYGNMRNGGTVSGTTSIGSTSPGTFKEAKNCYIQGSVGNLSSKITSANGNQVGSNLTFPFATKGNKNNGTDFRFDNARWQNDFRLNEADGLTGNPCLNGGTQDVGASIELPSTDMDYTSRVKDCEIDIGAYEADNEANITPQIVKNVEGTADRDIEDYVYYVTQNGYGNRSGDSPANAACADKLQSVLTAAGKKFEEANKGLKIGAKYNHADDAKAHKVYVKVAGYEPDESGDRFVYHANTLADANDPQSYTFLVPNGVWLMGGFNEGTTKNGVPDPSTYNWNDLQRDITDYQTILSAKTELKSGSAVSQVVNGYHAITFGCSPQGDLIEYGDTAVSYRAVVDGVYLTDGKATDNATFKSMGGGAIVPKNAHVRNCIVYNCQANQGGALFMMQGSMTSGCILRDNKAKQGGAIYAINGKETNKNYRSYMTNNTVVANSATIGGGIYMEDGALMTGNTIIWGNTATTDKNISGTVNQTYVDVVQGAFNLDDGSKDDSSSDSSTGTSSGTGSTGSTGKNAITKFYPFNACFVERYDLPGNIGNYNMTSDLESYFTGEGDYYPRPYSPLVGGGVISEYQQKWLSTGIQAWDIKGVTRNASGRLTAGAYAMSLPEIDDKTLFTRLFVSANGGANVKQEDREKYLGRSFYTPFNSLDAALSYIREAREKKIGGATEKTQFEILISGGTYVPSMYPVGTNINYKTDRRYQTFHIPVNVCIYGSFPADAKYSSDPVNKTGTSAVESLTKIQDRDTEVTLEPNGNIADILNKRNKENVTDRNENGLIEPWEFTNWTILSGDIKSSENEKKVYHVVYSEDVDSDQTSAERNNDVVLDGITIMNGQTQDEIDYDDDELVEKQSEVGHGGGIYSKNVGYTLNRCRVIRNIGVHGGGIYLKDGSLDIINSAISGNWAGSEDNLTETGEGLGGGVFAYFSKARKGNFHAINTIFANNSAANQSLRGGKGGAIYVHRASDMDQESNKDYNDVYVMNCLVVNNEANMDAAIHLDQGDIEGFTTLHPVVAYNTVIWNNADGKHPFFNDKTHMYHCASNTMVASGARDNSGNIELDTNNESSTGPRFKNPSLKVGKDGFNVNAQWNPAAISILTDAGAGYKDTDDSESGKYKDWWDLHKTRLEKDGYLTDYIKYADTNQTYARYKGPKSDNGSEGKRTIDIGLYEFQYPAFTTKDRNALYVGTTDEGTGDGSSWENQTSDLRGSIIAMANAEGNTGTGGAELSTNRKVFVKSGEYYSPTLSADAAYNLVINNKADSRKYVTSVEIVGACTGKTLDETQKIEQQNFASQTVIVPNGKADYATKSLLNITTNGRPVTISGFTFKNSSSNTEGDAGYGIKANINNDGTDTGAKLTLKNCGFSQNVLDGLNITNNQGKVLIYNTLFADNQKNGITASGDVTVVNATFANNDGADIAKAGVTTGTATGTSANNVKVYNTVSWKNASSILSGSDDDYTTNGNKLFSRAAVQANEGVLNDDVMKGPNFVDPDNSDVTQRNYTIRPSLALLNKGVNKWYIDNVGINETLNKNWFSDEKDFENKNRITGSVIDIGAYECDQKTQPVIYVKKGLAANGTGESWDSPYINLQSAINLAELYANTNTNSTAYVLVDKGAEMSNISISMPGVKVFGSMDGERTDKTIYKTDESGKEIEPTEQELKDYVSDLLGKRKGIIEQSSQSKINGLSMKFTIKSAGASTESKEPSVVDGFALSGTVDINNGIISTSIIEKDAEVKNTPATNNSTGTLYNSISYGKVAGVKAINVTTVATEDGGDGSLPSTEGSAFNRAEVKEACRYVSADNWKYQLEETSQDIDANSSYDAAKTCMVAVCHTKDIAGNNRVRNEKLDNGCFETWKVLDNYKISAEDYPHGKSVVYVADGKELSIGTTTDATTGASTYLYKDADNSFSPGFLLLGYHAGLRSNNNYIKLDNFAVEREEKANGYDICCMPYSIVGTDKFLKNADGSYTLDNSVNHYTVLTYNGDVRAAYDYIFDATGKDARGLSSAWLEGIPSGAARTSGMMVKSDVDQRLRFYGNSYEEKGEGNLSSIVLTQHNNQQPWSSSSDTGVKMTHKENMGWNLFGSPYLCAMNYGDMKYGRVIYAYKTDRNAYDAINTDGMSEGYIPAMDAVFTQTATLNYEENVPINRASATVGSEYQLSTQNARVALTSARASRSNSSEASNASGSSDSSESQISDELTFNAVDSYEAKNDYDMGADGVKWMISDEPQLYIERNGGRYSLLSAVNIAGSLNIGISVPEAGEYSLSIPEDCDNSKYETIWLKDAQTGKGVDLKEGSYTFQANAAGEISGRFSISFNRMEADNLSELSIYSTGRGNILLKGLQVDDRIKVYSASGIEVASELVSSSEESLHLSVSGTIIVEVTRDGKQIVVRKVAVR